MQDLSRLCIPLPPDLELSGLHLRDCESTFLLIERNRHYLRQWLGWLDNLTHLNDTRNFIHLGQLNAADGKGALLAIRTRGQIAGLIGFNQIDWENRHATIGYWLGESFQGKGIMTRSMTGLINWAFTEGGLNRLEVRCAIENQRSRAIPERLGFRPEGEIRQAEWLYDHFVDHVVYGLLREDWAGIPG